MSGWYQKGFEILPLFLKRRIHPLKYEIEDFASLSAQGFPGLLVLDTGAGESGLRRHFSHCRYLALDLASGDQAWDYSGLDVIGDLNVLPIAENKVDVILNFQVLEHVQSPGKVIEELYRVLKPGGRLRLTAPQGWHEHQQPRDFFRFTRFSLRMMMGKAGFGNIEITPMGGYFRFMGMWLSFIPKILFQTRSIPARIILFPLELLSLGLFCFLTPLCCYYLDRFDRKKEFTLCYKCSAVKPEMKAVNK
ncbi:MAG: class I SAM-dependent methyltransferase [Acidobacteriota bacterium]